MLFVQVSDQVMALLAVNNFIFKKKLNDISIEQLRQLRQLRPVQTNWFLVAYEKFSFIFQKKIIMDNYEFHKKYRGVRYLIKSINDIGKIKKDQIYSVENQHNVH